MSNRYVVIYRNPHHGPEATGAAGPFDSENEARARAVETPWGSEFEVVNLVIDTEEKDA